MKNIKHSLSIFYPLIQKWFVETIGEPTDIQNMSWPKIANKENVLITGPTGSGKILTAFLWSINSLITGQISTGQTGILSLSPLKSLNNDIQRNLSKPLQELRRMFNQNHQLFPDIKVFTRSGDTE